MRMISLGCAVLAAALLNGCNQSKSASYYQAHPTEAAQVSINCERGARVGQDCASAANGTAMTARNKREKALSEWAKKGYKP